MPKETKLDPKAERPGTWFNKRHVARIEFGVPHTLAPHNDGWRMDALDDGELRLVFTDGGKDEITARRGDSLLSSANDLYFAPAQEDATDDERGRRPGSA